MTDLGFYSSQHIILEVVLGFDMAIKFNVSLPRYNHGVAYTNQKL
jgi:hypothetical protein